MNDQLRSELLKLRSTRTTAVLLLTGIAVTLLTVVAQGTATKLAELAQEDAQRDMFGGATAVVLFATYVGVLAVTNEYRYGTIRPTLVVQPRRELVLGAKLAAVTLAGAIFAAVGVGASFLAGAIVLHARHVDFAVSGTHVTALVLGTLAGSCLCAILGACVGALVRNQVGAIVALAAWSLAVESVLFATVPSVGRFLPGEAGNAAAGMTTAHLLTPGAGAAVLAGWTAALVVAAARRTRTSDVA